MFLVMIAMFLVGMLACLLLWYQQQQNTTIGSTRSQPSWYHAEPAAALYEYKPKPRIYHLRPEATSTNNNHEQQHPRSLLLLRHAKSSRDDPTTSSSTSTTGTHHYPLLLDDMDRPLAPEGQLAALQLADYVLHHNVPPPDVIYVSPSIRTLATLALVRSQGWALQNVPMMVDQRLYDFFEGDKDDAFHSNNNSYLEYLRNLDNDNTTKNYRRIMIVGHNPLIGDLAQRLVVQDDDSAAATAAIDKFSPGSLCDIHWNHLEHWAQLEEGTGELELFVRPKKSSL
jgi:phosphohistidine phosphatase